MRNIDGGYGLSQQHYIETLAERFGINEVSCEGVNLPYMPSVKLTSDFLPKAKEDIKKAQKLPYQELVGALNYLMITRPELSYCQSQLAKFMGNWGEKHYKAGTLELKYLIKTKTKVLSIRPMLGGKIKKL